MRRLVSFTWMFTTLLFLGVLLWEYAYLPESVGVLPGTNGETTTFVERENFFYIVLGAFAFSNAIFFGLRRLILFKMKDMRKKESAEKAELKQNLSDWVLGFAASFNVFLMLGLIYIGFYNNSSGVNLAHYSPLVYGGPVLMVILLLVLIYILLKKRSGIKI